MTTPKTPQTPPADKTDDKTPQTPATPPANDQPKTGKPGRKPGQPAKEWDFTGLDVTVLSDPRGVTAELASLAAPMRARDARQVAIDQVATALHREWIDAGKPERWAQMPKRSYHVPPQAADTLRMLVRRATSFLGLSAKFGKPVRDKDGREIVVFGVRDLRIKKAKVDDTWTLADLREFATEYFADDEDAAVDFLAALTGEGEEDSESETAGSESPDSALRAVEWVRSTGRNV